MYILSPKSNFLGGSLVSASHLGKLFEDRLFIWDTKSEFLDVNEVKYKTLDPSQPIKDIYSEFTKKSNLDPRYFTNRIWCNDTCVNEGYWEPQLEQNMKLFKFLSLFSEVHIHNHQPISRTKDYLVEMLSILKSAGCKIYFYNYRACWNDEFEFYLRPIFRDIQVSTSPYHYYIPDEFRAYNPAPHTIKGAMNVCSIGRSNSKCKIQSKNLKIKNALYKSNETELMKLFHSELLPDLSVSNIEFLRKLSKFHVVLTGFYWGGEGNPELNKPYNKLEWSYLDAIIASVFPITNELFVDELKRLGLCTEVLKYDLNKQDWNLLHRTIMHNTHFSEGSRDRVIRELEFGNRIMKDILTS